MDMKPPPVTARLAFNFAKWDPTQSQYCLAMSIIQQEERERIRKFRYQSDAKASLAGPLLIRNWIKNTFPEISGDAITLARSERGRPFWKRTGPQPSVDFNVSHAGDYSVLASSNLKVGVDVMP